MLKNKEHGAKRFRTVLGGIAQLARVLGSYPIGHWFESSCRYHEQDTRKGVFFVVAALYE